MSTIAIALIYEHSKHDEKYIEALDKWRQLGSDQACLRTVNILRKPIVQKKSTIFEYIKWVLQKKPDIGLKLFTERQAFGSSNDSVSQRSGQQQLDQYGGGTLNELTHEEILEYLSEIEKSLDLPIKELISERKNLVDKAYPYREKYLEFILNKGESAEKFETMLAELYIEKLFDI